MGSTIEKNLCGKTRPVGKPYEIWESPDGSWQWCVLKKYQRPMLEAKNPGARWFCGVRSPFTYGDHELGDVYVQDVITYARLTFRDPVIVQVL